jgi:predicted nuclease of predicted toxin-antitoxin system
MKLLFDHNLSPRLVTRLHDVFPDADHVMNVGLARATDEVVWQYSLMHDYTIVTKDSDFNDLSILRGSPPKVIWLAVGNCTTDVMESTIRKHIITLHQFLSDPSIGLLTLY